MRRDQGLYRTAEFSHVLNQIDSIYYLGTSICFRVILNFDCNWVLCVGLLQKNAKVVSIDGYEDVPPFDENALKKAVAHQPVSVAIEASGMAYQLYDSVS